MLSRIAGDAGATMVGTLTSRAGPAPWSFSAGERFVPVVVSITFVVLGSEVASTLGSGYGGFANDAVMTNTLVQKHAVEKVKDARSCITSSFNLNGSASIGD